MKTRNRIITVLAAATATTALITTGAYAAVPASGYKITATKYADGGWMGSYKLASGVRGYRIDPRANTSDPSYGPISYITNFDPSSSTGLRRTAEAAYVLSNFGGRADDAQDAGVNVAELDLLRGGIWTFGNAYTTRRISQTAWPSYVTSYTKTMLADAAKYAGPYKSTLSATRVAAGSTSTVTYALYSASGHALASIPVSITVTGKTLSGKTNSSGVVTFAVKTTAAGPIPFTIRATNLPATELAIVKPSKSGASRLALAGKTTSLTSSGQVQAYTAQTAKFTNAASLRTLNQYVDGTATVAGGYGARSLTFKLYRSSSAATGCTGTPIYTHTQTISGPGSTGSYQYKAGVADFYRWSVTSGTNAYTSNTATTCGAAVQVYGPQKVTMTNNAATRRVGQIMQGHASLAGGYGARTLTFKLYRSTSKSMTCSGTPLYTHSISASGGTYYTMKWTLKGAYYFRWYVTVAKNSYTSNTTSACGAVVTVTK